MVTAKDVEQDLKKPEYNFLRENEHLGDNIILLTLGGSKAYGTNVDTPEHTSDTDIRGIAIKTRFRTNYRYTNRHCCVFF